MISSKWFVIDGKPIPLKRARHSNKKIYDPQKNAKLIWGLQIKKQCGIDPVTGLNPVYEQLKGYCFKMLMKFYMPIPPTRRKTRPGDLHFITPDLSNLIKFVEDVCTGIVYKDDCLITECHAVKIYDLQPRTEFKFIVNGDAQNGKR